MASRRISSCDRATSSWSARVLGNVRRPGRKPCLRPAATRRPPRGRVAYEAAVISELVPRCRSEIVVLADARQRFEAGTLRALVGPFADPRVGAVGGQLILTSGPETRPAMRGIGLYWRIESAIRLGESRID